MHNPTDEHLNIGDAIRDERLRRGLTQAQFGALVGASAITVSRWERGCQDILRENREALAEVMSDARHQYQPRDFAA